MLHTNVVDQNAVNILCGIVFDVHGAYRKHLYFFFFFLLRTIRCRKNTRHILNSSCALSTRITTYNLHFKNVVLKCTLSVFTSYFKKRKTFALVRILSFLFDFIR